MSKAHIYFESTHQLRSTLSEYTTEYVNFAKNEVLSHIEKVENYIIGLNIGQEYLQDIHKEISEQKQEIISNSDKDDVEEYVSLYLRCGLRRLSTLFLL